MLWVLIGGNRNRVVCSLLALIWFRQISGSVSAIALRQCWLVTFVAVAFTRSVFFDKFLLNATNIATYWPLHRLDYVGLIRSCIPQLENITCIKTYKKLSYRQVTARCVVPIEILPIATQQCRNYLYDKS